MTIRKPLLSIVVPTYNQGPYIEQCLSSIKKQSYVDIEVVIRDSESNDQTEEICRRFVARDSRFRYYREKDNGQSDALNLGLHLTHGDYWTWICSDDFYADDGALERLAAKLKIRQACNPLCVGIYGEAVLCDDEGRSLAPYYTYARDLIRDDFRLTWPLAQPSSILLRHRVLQVGGIDSELHLGMDLDLFIRMLASKHYLAFEPGVVAGIRVQPNSKSVKYRVATAQNALRIVKRHFHGSASAIDSDFHRELRDALKEQAPNQFSLAVMNSWGVVRPLMRRLYQWPIFAWVPYVGTPVKKCLLRASAILDGWRFAWRQRRSP